MEIQDDSSLSKEWATQEFEFPVQLLVEDRKYEDPRYKVRLSFISIAIMLIDAR